MASTSVDTWTSLVVGTGLRTHVFWFSLEVHDGSIRSYVTQTTRMRLCHPCMSRGSHGKKCLPSYDHLTSFFCQVRGLWKVASQPDCGKMRQRKKPQLFLVREHSSQFYFFRDITTTLQTLLAGGIDFLFYCWCNAWCNWCMMMLMPLHMTIG